ncbi:hypothetical protein JS756_22985 [Streptomyces actuosus]|uniref:DUF4231 domain-containing protein n=1 Tax=Streptomyces actuosus TaxID=1885 RepID=A0ABS2VV68_STRAS|nr:hypothetical protein [Streptomyces actuosus]MBN0046926.1 hypothetical protein [Streptomyces actuosus]
MTSMGTVAAPLLAGFSLSVTVQALRLGAGDVRWPDLAALLFLLAAALLVFAVQAVFWARRHLVTAQDLMAWWPDWEQPYRRSQLIDELKLSKVYFDAWSNRARRAYSLGLLSLLSGLTVVAVPAGPTGAAPNLRWAAVALGTAATLTEAAWVVLGEFLTANKLKRGGRLEAFLNPRPQLPKEESVKS